MRFVRFVALLSVAVSLATGAFAQDRRVALLVGNASYQTVSPLKNPLNDATDLGQMLTGLGFEVTLVPNAPFAQMRDEIRRFGQNAEGADLALFYFGGHGIQVAGQNYLLPVDTTLDREADLEFETIRLDLVMEQMLPATTRIVLLDACRNNPFLSRLGQSMPQSRSTQVLQKGLKRVYSDQGVFIAYATEPDEVAFDGTGRNSPFAAALLQYMDDPALEINALMTRVRASVYDETGKEQRPWSSSSLLTDVHLARGSRPAVKTDAADPDVEPPQKEAPTPLASLTPQIPDRTKPAPVAPTAGAQDIQALLQQAGANLTSRIAAYPKLGDLTLLPDAFDAEDIKINRSKLHSAAQDRAVTHLSLSIKSTWGRTLVTDYFLWVKGPSGWEVAGHGDQLIGN